LDLTRFICRPSRISSNIPQTQSYRPKRSACYPCHDSIVSCSTFGERTAGLAQLSELKRYRGREQKVCGNSWQLSTERVSRRPCGPKKNCSTIGFGRRALKISSICRPAPSKNEENDKFAGQILPPSVVHQCFRHPRLMSSVVDVKIPVQTSGGDKQGGPENLRRKFASNGSSPRHLCIEQALNLADRYR
jgi:hypothetical protein